MSIEIIYIHWIVYRKSHNLHHGFGGCNRNTILSGVVLVVIFPLWSNKEFNKNIIIIVVLTFCEFFFYY